MLVSFLLLFDAFWSLLAPFWHPWAPFCRPWVPCRNKNRSGANWGRIRGPNRSSFWAQVSHFLGKSVLGSLFRRSVLCIVFLSFLAAPGYPQTMKIKQNPCSVARNQGLARVGKTTSRDHFWLRFGGIFEASERHLCVFLCF